MFHLPEPTGPRGPVPLHQWQPVLRTRQTHSAHERPFEFTADEPTTARPEGKPIMPMERAPEFFIFLFQNVKGLHSTERVGKSLSSVSWGH